MNDRESPAHDVDLDLAVDEVSLYEEVLAKAGSRLPRPRAPRASAAVAPWRRGPGGRIEVFWVRRSERVSFMPGWHAFPGGTVAKSDAAVPVTGIPEGFATGGGGAESVPRAALMEGEVLPADPAPGLVACALRELFEETGLLPVPGHTPLDPDAVQRARAQVLEDPARFSSAVAALGLTLDASPLVYAGRWLTPPFAPIRFDNRFFLLEWAAQHPLQPRVHPGELEEGEWVEPAQALRRWRTAEVIAAPPILHLLTVLAEEAPESALPRLRDPVEADLGPDRRIEFRPGVVMIPVATPTLPPATHTNCYLLGLEEAVVVDPGSPDPAEQERLLATVTAARERLGRMVVAIWLTHHHPDHVSGAAALRQALEVPVLAHRETAERLQRLGVTVDDTLADGDARDLGQGFRVSVLHTPGHARGHLCFFAETHRSLLCGDLASALSTVVIDPPHGDMEEYLGSLRRAADLDPATLFPAHGPVLLQGRRTLEGIIEHRSQREARVLAAWRQGVREPEAIVRHAYDQVSAPARPLAVRQVRAHLEHLRRRGEIEQDP